jgi:hypothetical protein
MVFPFKRYSNGPRVTKKELSGETERDNVMGRGLERVKREIAMAKRTGKKRPLEWLAVDLDTGDVAPPPNAVHVVSKPRKAC